MTSTVKLNDAYVKSIKNAPSFSLKDKIGYMCGDLGFNSLQVMVNSYLMLFCVNIMGMDATHFAAIVFICKALDALNDTFIGRVVDKRPASPYGKMRPYLKWFAIPYALFTIVLFLNMSVMPYGLKVAWVLIIYSSGALWAPLSTCLTAHGVRHRYLHRIFRGQCFHLADRSGTGSHRL